MGEKFTFKRCEIKIMILLKFSQKRRHYSNTTHTHHLYSAQHSTHYSRHLCLSTNPTNLFYPSISIFRPSGSKKKGCVPTSITTMNCCFFPFSPNGGYYMQNFSQTKLNHAFLILKQVPRKKSITSLWTTYRSKNNK